MLLSVVRVDGEVLENKMEHCTTSIIQDDLSELFSESSPTIEHINNLIGKIKDTARSLEDLKLAARGVIEYYEEERGKSSELDKVLIQLESLIQE